MPSELRQRADVAAGHLEVHVALEALGGDHVPEQIDDLLALGRDLHLHDRVVEQVAPVARRRRAHVVAGALRHQLHRDQARVRVAEHALHVREVGHVHAVEVAVGGVRDRLVEGVGRDPDRGPAEVVLADVDRVERRVPGFVAARKDVVLGDRVVVQLELRTRTTGC